MKKADIPAQTACWKPSTNTRSAKASTASTASLETRAWLISTMSWEV
jgi:hypothetical protein